MVAAHEIKLDMELSFEKFTNPKVDKEIISSRTFREGNWKKVCVLRNSFKGVTKHVIPVDFREFCMLVVTEVEPGAKIPNHTHKEGIVRYITKGSLKLNGTAYKAGDWIMVPEGMSYEIETEEGYASVAGYLAACGPPPD